MGKVVFGNFKTRLDLPLKRILDGAAEAELSPCILIGLMPDGEFYMAGTSANTAENLLLIERGKKFLLDQVD